MRTIKGPAIFLAQFAGDAAPFNSFDAICGWAANYGYKGVQIPTWVGSLIDLEKAATSKTYADELKGTAAKHGVEITELSTHLQGQLVAVHPAYDLASVLEDARRDVSPEIERLMLDRYIAATGNAEALERAYWALAAQRNTRILGVFTRLWKRDNKPHYTAFQPRMWGLLERDLERPGLEPVKLWFDVNIAPEHRAARWAEAA